MKKNSLQWRVAALMAIPLMAPGAIYGREQCEAFAKYGIYDTRDETSDTDKVSSFRSWFCQSKFESQSSANAAGGDLGYGDFTLALNSNNEDWNEFSSNYCRDDTYNQKYRQKTTSIVKTINNTASNNMLACFNRGGLHVRIIPGVRQDTFFIDTRYNATGVTPHARVANLTVVGAKCNGPLINGYLITAAGAEQVCKRIGKQAVDVSLTASEVPTWDSPRGLKEIGIVPPLPSKEPITIRADEISRGTNVAIDQCVVGPGTLANAPPCQDAANAAEFDFMAKRGGAYRLDVNFAAAASRPLRVILNGKVIRDQALGQVTGGWENKFLRWTEIGQVTLKPGSNVIRLERGGVFPHIHDLRFIPVAE